jgi:peptidoglycan LD-endopeptidase LytH
MKNLYILAILIAFFGISCTSVTNKIFNHLSPREAYENSIEDTPEGQEWLQASVTALQKPTDVSLPFCMNGFFPADKPRSLGLKFKAKRGEQVRFQFTRNDSTGVVYTDLFSAFDIGASPIITADTGSSVFSFDIENTGEYVLRLQPELFREAGYDLIITSGPSLGFPVAGKKSRIGSFWGADRDGGKRSHEGIDIFAPKRTPVIASADGIITRVKEGGIGGKVVWQRIAGKSISLYYAHLDEQLVQPGQLVKKGDTLGLVGNTGNARTTPTHLHFGIYTYGGAIDPLSFVKLNTVKMPGIPEKDIKGKQFKLVRSRKVGELEIKANALLDAVGVTSRGYILGYPGVIIPFSDIKVNTGQLTGNGKTKVQAGES